MKIRISDLSFPSVALWGCCLLQPVRVVRRLPQAGYCLEVQSKYNPTITSIFKPVAVILGELGDVGVVELGYTHRFNWVRTTPNLQVVAKQLRIP